MILGMTLLIATPIEVAIRESQIREKFSHILFLPFYFSFLFMENDIFLFISL